MRLLSAAMRTIAATALLCVIAGPARNALATPEHGSYVHADPARVDIRPIASHSSSLIYLNGCFESGCNITPGNESSIDNTSSIISSTQHIPPFSGGLVEWEAIVSCVRDTYRPFDIQITDKDPGDVPHFEAIVAGQASDLGFPGPVGGVAPFLCGEIINNAITFSFPQRVDNDLAQTCWIVAQETAHAFGLDHEHLCSDPLTYLRSCDPSKRFQNVDARCGEFSPRDCSCLGTTQNSYQRLLDHFGPRVPTPPKVAITSPAEGDRVEPGFPLRVEASDDLQLARVEVRINSIEIARSETPPFVFSVPTTISDGRLRIEVTAFDRYGDHSSAVANVLQGEACRAGSSDCAALEVCVSGRCVPGPDAEGGLGQVCEGAADCASQRCGRSDGTNVCTEECEGAATCPDGFGCLQTNETSICWPGFDDVGGCSIRGRVGSTRFPLPLFGALLLLFWLRFKCRQETL